MLNAWWIFSVNSCRLNFEKQSSAAFSRLTWLKSTTGTNDSITLHAVSWACKRHGMTHSLQTPRVDHPRRPRGSSRSYSKLSPTKIPATRLTAPGSPRMRVEKHGTPDEF